jgi:hypothetical protein
MSFAAMNLCVASQRVFVIVVDFVIDSVRTLLDTLSYSYKRNRERERERETENCQVIQLSNLKIVYVTVSMEFWS